MIIQYIIVGELYQYESEIRLDMSIRLDISQNE